MLEWPIGNYATLCINIHLGSWQSNHNYNHKIMNSKATYFAIVDDDLLVRFVLRNRLQELSNTIVIIEASNGQDFLNELQSAPILPDICLLDIKMPVLDGYDAQKLLSKLYPSIKTIVLSQYCQQYAIESMILAGARGIISKHKGLFDLKDPVNSVLESGYYYSDVASASLFHQLREDNAAHQVQLTTMEKVVLELLCSDLDYAEIANNLSKSIHTIKKHVSTLMRKTNTNSREGLILFSVRNEIAEI